MIEDDACDSQQLGLTVLLDELWRIEVAEDKVLSEFHRPADAAQDCTNPKEKRALLDRASEVYNAIPVDDLNSFYESRVNVLQPVWAVRMLPVRTQAEAPGQERSAEGDHSQGRGYSAGA
jgi:hypothetical protein